MPQFTPWNVPSPFPNVLYNPAAVDAAIADTQSKLGELDVNRQKLGIEQRKLDLQQSGGQSLIDSLTKGDGTGTSPPADSTPFEQKMGLSEGGGSADKVNSGGYAGQFQFGSERLADLGLYTPAPGEGRNGWKGKFNIAPYNVSTLDDFLKNPAAQHAAFVAHVADIDKTIDATPGADKFDRNGLRAVAHLGGTGSMRAFIAAGGNLDRADSNGTSLKDYYTKFAQGGPAALQKSFGSVHGPGGPPSDIPAVQPGGTVPTAWVTPNAPLPIPPVPPAPFNPNAGPRAAPVVAPGAIPPPAPMGGDPNAQVRIPPTVQTGEADAPVTVTPSRIALRTGGTDAAGPGAGPDTTLPAVQQPNRMYETGLPGIQISAPGNPLAPPPVAAQAPVAAPAGTTPPGAATRPPILQPPPAPSRVIPLEPVLPSGLTAGQVRLAASMVQSGAPIADVAAHVEQWKQANLSGRQQAATQAALEAQQNYDRQRQFRQDQIEAEKTAYQRQQDLETARRNAASDARAEVAAKNAGLPPGYRLDDKGIATRIDGLPPDPAVAQAAKDAFDAKQRENPIQGQELPAQHENTLIAGTKNGQTDTPEYASAYINLAKPVYNPSDGSFVKPNMNAYARPTYKPPGATEVPDYTSQDTPGALPPPAVMTTMLGNVSGIRNIDSVLKELAAHPDSIGPKALLPGWLTQRTDPEGVALRAGIADIMSQTFHDRSGASVTVSESPRLKPFVPDATDTAATLRTKLSRIREIYRDVLNDNYAVYGPGGTGRALPGVEAALKQGTSPATPATQAGKPPPPGFKVIQ